MPEPRANARLAQDPEPKPEKQRELEAEGNKPAGQAEAGNDTHSPLQPAAATAWTQAMDRRANAPRPEPNSPDATEKTFALGQANRTTASTPGAQPTTTFAERGTDAIAPRSTLEGIAPAGRREPENPTTEAEAKS